MQRTTAVLCVAWISFASGALAQDAGVPRPPHVARDGGVAAPHAAAAPALTVPAQLAQTDPAVVRAGIDAAAAAPSAANVAALGARIRDGLTPELLDAAVAALVRMHRPDAGPVLARLVAHRRASVRRDAIAAIVSLHASGAETALVGALDDGDPTVRGAAALALAQLGARGALPALLDALAHGLREAATAVGKLAGAGQVPRVLALLDAHGLALVAPALSELVHRADLPAASKLAVVARLAARDAADARQFLHELAASLPEGDPVRHAAEEGASGAAPPEAPAAHAAPPAAPAAHAASPAAPAAHAAPPAAPAAHAAPATHPAHANDGGPQ